MVETQALDSGAALRDKSGPMPDPDAKEDSAQKAITRTALLAVLYFVFGQASFLVLVDNVLVTPVVFASEGIALAFALRYGAGVWPGVFVGQLALGLARGLPWPASLGISAANSIEAVLAVMLFRAFGLEARLRRARDLAGLLILIFFVLQPLSATLGNGILLWNGVMTDPAELPASWLDWWIGNTMGQMLVTPLLLAIFYGTHSRAQLARDMLVPLAALSPSMVVGVALLHRTGVASLVLLLVPIFVFLAIYRGVVSVCVGGLFVAACALYATSHGFGPFVSAGDASILELNMFLVGHALSGQFLAVFLRQLRDQRKTEEELRAANEQLQRTAYELTENIPVGTYTMVQPPSGGTAFFSFLSTRFLELTGLEREAAVENPMNAFACVHPDDHAEWVRKNTYVFEHKLPFSEECRIIVKGQTRWIHAESRPRDLPDGSVVWEGALTDITARKEAESKLAANESRLQRILDNIPVPVAINTLDHASRITFLNSQFTNTFGYTLGEIPTVDTWALRAYPDEQYREATLKTWRVELEKAKQNHETIGQMEFRVRCKDGSYRDVLINAVSLGDMLLVGFVDMTEQKTAAAREIELELEHRRDLERKLKTSLHAAAVAHEINQPLSAILLQSKIAIGSESGTGEALRSIAVEAQRVVATIDKMKTLLRNVQTEHHPVDLAAVVQSAILYKKSLLARQDITLETSGTDHPALIMGDEAQLQLALTNLIRNAAEAIEECRPRERKIAIHLRHNDDNVELSVGDSGPGWSGAEQTDTPLTTTKKGGTGIGLYVVRTAVQNHRGKIEFGRSPLGGAEVKIIFPRGAARK